MESEAVNKKSIMDDTEITSEGQEPATSIEEDGDTKDDSITENAATSVTETAATSVTENAATSVTENAATSVTEDDAAKEQTATSNEGDTEGDASKQDTEECVLILLFSDILFKVYHKS